MGGTLFGMTDKIDKKRYTELVSKISTVLTSRSIEHRPLKQINEKETFGDIDFLVSRFYFKDVNIIEFIKTNFNVTEVKTISEGVSFLYEGTQVDFILVDYRNIDCISVFYDYNDVGNLIGRLAKFYHCKFKPNGLCFELYDNNKDRKLLDIFISNDIKKIFEFLDIDYEVYSKGFKTYKEAFDFIIKSKCFNSKVYSDRRYINGHQWSRNKFRNTYKLFLEYVSTLHLNKKEYLRGSVDNNINHVDSFFPEIKFKNVIEEAIQQEKNRQKAKAVYNGDIIREYTGLRDKELGLFKQYLDVNYIDKLPKPIYEYSPIEIRWQIIFKYEEYKANKRNENS